MGPTNSKEEVVAKVLDHIDGLEAAEGQSKEEILEGAKKLVRDLKQNIESPDAESRQLIFRMDKKIKDLEQKKDLKSLESIQEELQVELDEIKKSVLQPTNSPKADTASKLVSHFENASKAESGQGKGLIEDTPEKTKEEIL